MMKNRGWWIVIPNRDAFFQEMNSILNVESVTKVYRSGGRDLVVLEGIDFAVEAGSSCAIVGPSGSGKTTLLNLLGGHATDTLERLGLAEQLPVHQLGLAEPVHPGTGVLQAEHEPAGQLPDTALQLRGRDGLLRDAVPAFGEQGQHLVDVLRGAPGVQAEQAGVRVTGGEGVDRVGKPSLLPDLLEEPRGHPAPEQPRENLCGEEIRFAIGRGLEAHDEMTLLELARIRPDAARISRWFLDTRPALSEPPE